MDKYLLEEFETKSNDYLLDIYLNKANEYREEALVVIEYILNDRKIAFQRPDNLASNESNKSNIPQKTKIEKKIFRKVFIYLFLISLLPLLSHIVYREGKLSTNDRFFMLFHGVYKIVGFPLVFLEPATDNHLISIMLLVINVFLLSYLIAYLICKWKET